ncbi:Putative glucose-methanol-choline oxidoreductase, FAD/NAD(P)-binding domain superfamily [Septoria linicola]|uniref:Glucose-methanol-choline oxidoreductase, FAD/NAD(P)-binding domain superfamily n=1 Tax=Septoria linicola TaxID=215465 RepID=A0A9Q9AVK5_9PEZI|nr:Putative glucose-methanol-choline oxidoreductase, FAD/NAD(P)-binding domain superfamily [Septoria linicola]
MRLHRFVDFALLVSALAVPAQQHKHEDTHQVRDDAHSHKHTKQKRQYIADPYQQGIYDYIVVGSGPGGGPLACRLARAGFNTLLIEAGTDTSGYVDTQIPSYHPRASELPRQLWQYFVKRYADPALQLRDPKFTYKTPDLPIYGGAEYTGQPPPRPGGWTYLLPNGRYYVGFNPPPGAEPLGLLYARGSALGGSTQMSAMAMVTPHEEDWTNIGLATGNLSGWDPDVMRSYFVKLERCRYLIQSVVGHGFNGWLDPLTLVLRDLKLLSLIIATATALGKTAGFIGEALATLTGLAHIFAADLNAPGPTRDQDTDVWQVPASVDPTPGTRSGVVNFIHETVQRGHPLTVQLDTFVTKILIDNNGYAPRAFGVAYEYGPNLQYTSPLATGAHGVPGYVFARREVIISCGAYETPKLLKLSGIGPAQELAQWGIPIVRDLPGVGLNMQDRYEIGSVGVATTPFKAFAPCTYSYTLPDPCLDEFQRGTTEVERGPYTSNGLALGTTFRSSVADDLIPDIFIVAVPAYFAGYYPGYARAAVLDAIHWTFVVLKMKTRNNAGTVTLRSLDPLDQPEINFNNFAIGGDLDVQAVAEGVQRARDIYNLVIPLDGSLTEEVPGPAYLFGPLLNSFIRDYAWGHHVCCTAKIGNYADPFAVVDDAFRVFGIDGLRIVDNSVWPRIPAYYPTVPLYMMSEKAADVILGQPPQVIGLDAFNSFDAGGIGGTLGGAIIGTVAGLGNPDVGPAGILGQLGGLLGATPGFGGNPPAKLKRWIDRTSAYFKRA